jgi:phage terminase large subunit-like protein
VSAAVALAPDEDSFTSLLPAVVLVARTHWGGLARFLEGLSGPVLRAMFHEWRWQAHEGQQAPKGSWRTWLFRGGRGCGKTLAGAQWVTARARENPGARIALVGETIGEVVRVMIEGPSGLLAAARCDEDIRWAPTRQVLHFGSGATAYVYSARTAEKLRGPEHDFAWCDELGKWRKGGEAAWDNLRMGLRRGDAPQTIVTTTPRPTALLSRVRGLKGTVETIGRTADNAHLAVPVRDDLYHTYGGTRLGRQELDAELFEEVAGALWTRGIMERARVAAPPVGELKRIVVGVDPPATAEGDACGIVVCGLGRDDVVYVLADCSVSGLRPEGWARAVVRAAAAWEADRVIAEKNQGGDMVASVLRSVDAGLPVRLVSATKGKVARAEPVAARFETGRAKLAGRFPELEDELAGLTHGGGYEGAGQQPRPGRRDGLGDRRAGGASRRAAHPHALGREPRLSPASGAGGRCRPSPAGLASGTWIALRHEGDRPRGDARRRWRSGRRRCCSPPPRPGRRPGPGRSSPRPGGSSSSGC